MKTIHRILLATGVAMVAAPPAAANHSWDGWHWPKGRGEVAVQVDDNVSSQWDSYLQIAVLGTSRGGSGTPGWNDSTMISSRLAPGSVNPQDCPAVTARIEVCNAAYGNNGWLGLASIWLAGGHISQATTMLNDTYFNTPAFNTPAWRRAVTCQEVGHDYGLSHQDEGFENSNLGSCMDYTNGPSGGVVGAINFGASNEYPNVHDYDELAQIYSHLDRRPPASAAAAQAFRDGGLSGKSMAQWGRPIHIDRAGRPDMFVLDFGGGYRKVTHVFWAPGQGPRR